MSIKEQSASHLEDRPANSIKRTELLLTLKLNIIDRLNLDTKPEDMVNDVPIFGTGLGLDSVDALLLALVIESEFGVEVNDEDISEFESLNSIADFIEARGAK